MGSALGCARCGHASTIAVIEFSATQAYIDLCEEHMQELLEGARPLGDRRVREPATGVMSGLAHGEDATG